MRTSRYHHDNWIHHATTVSHTVERLHDVDVCDGCSGACPGHQSPNLRAVGGAALASQSPLTTSDLMFCRFSHNTTMQYRSQKDRPQYLPHEFHTSNPAIKTPKRPEVIEQSESYQNPSTATAISSTKTESRNSRRSFQTSKQCSHDFQCAISELSRSHVWR